MTAERLQKILSRAGVASRRKAEELITDGLVKVNGKVVSELGAKADIARDRIEVEGHGKLHAPAPVWVLLNKPKNVVVTERDPQGRPTAIALLKDRSRASRNRGLGEEAFASLHSVGRLDYDAEGVLLFTNQGDLANALLHPRHHVPKSYAVRVRNEPDERALERLRNGIRLDGEKTKPADVSVRRRMKTNTWLDMTITEGRNRQVKRMCEAVGLDVMRLIRTGFAGLTTGELAAGEWRFLTRDEIEALERWAE